MDTTIEQDPTTTRRKGKAERLRNLAYTKFRVDFEVIGANGGEEELEAGTLFFCVPI